MKSNKHNEETAVAVVSIHDGIEAVNTQIKKLKHITESVYKTNGVMKGFPVNLCEQTDKGTLVTMLSSAQYKEKAYQEAADSLGFKTTPVFKCDGYAVSDWFEDIKLRFAIIDNKQTLDSLNTMKREWEELMDKEDKKTLLIKKMEKFASTGEVA